MKHTAPTFGEFAEHVYMSLFSWLNNSTANTLTLLLIDIQKSKKKKKGSRIEALVPTGMQTIKNVGSNQKTPKQMKRFLALGSNKESLIEFFFQFLKTLNSNYFEDFTVLVVHDFKCYCLYGN